MSPEERTQLAERAERALKELLHERAELRKGAGLPDEGIYGSMEYYATVENPIRRVIEEVGRG